MIEIQTYLNDSNNEKNGSKTILNPLLVLKDEVILVLVVKSLLHCILAMLQHLVHPM